MRDSTWLDWRPLGMWILGETFREPEKVSPLRERARARGVWMMLPECKTRNSWRWLCLRVGPGRPVYVIRWTLPRFCA
jgi:hypothetical protein